MGRRGKAGRKGATSKAAAATRGMTSKEKAHFVFMHRHLIVKRRENRIDSERDDLTRMLEYLPELATLRRFADVIRDFESRLGRFDPAVSEALASGSMDPRPFEPA